MTEILVGEYQLGYRPVRLYADPSDCNGRVDLIPNDKQATKVIVGCNDTWPEVLSVLLHEIYECMLIDLSARYKKQPSYTSSASEFIFLLSHNQLDEAHSRVSYFLDDALKPFQLVWADIQEKKNKKKEKKK